VNVPNLGARSRRHLRDRVRRLLTTTFTEPKDRGKAFGVFGAIAAAGGAVGLLLGGALTEYLSWRWTLPPGRTFQQRIDMGERVWSAAKSTQPKGDPP
jgi:Major Facilitator Superfamily